MHYGGAFYTSKNNVIKNLNRSHIPTTALIQPKTSFSELKQQLNKNNLEFPVIAKPDKGERGKGVEKLDSLKALLSYHERFSNIPFLVQEYIDYPIELGILFFWDKNGTPTISSVTQKVFCHIVGNGTDNFGTLVQQNSRIKHRIKTIETRFEKQWNSIPEKGAKIMLEPIGNHNKGTMFLDARSLISKDMLNWIESCAKKIPNFDYGRFDVKLENKNAFASTNQNDVKVMEVNGVNSEPCHIYDPDYSLLQAYKDIFYHMRIIYDLSKKKSASRPSKNKLIPFLKTGYKVAINKTLYS